MRTDSESESSSDNDSEDMVLEEDENTKDISLTDFLSMAEGLKRGRAYGNVHRPFVPTGEERNHLTYDPDMKDLFERCSHTFVATGRHPQFTDVQARLNLQEYIVDEYTDSTFFR